LELIILALLVSFLVMMPIGIRAVSREKGGFAKRIASKGFVGYGMAAGAFPDFWLSLILIFIFYAVLGWAPAPIGQLDIAVLPPEQITGMYLIDSLVTGNWPAFLSHLKHIVLPVFVLAFVYGGAVLKVAVVAAGEVQKSDFIDYAKVCALPSKKIQKYVTRAVYPPVATMGAIVFGFLVGGAVLVETVFSWGGFGQYAVQSVINADFAAVQGVVLVSAVLNLIVYIAVDMVYYWVDPRIKSLG
jgi:peptide/nickel transport system permease protein